VHRLRQGRPRGAALNARGAGLAFGVAAAVVVVDQVSKAWVLDHVTPGPHHLVGPLGIELSRNSGVAFSMLSGHSATSLALAVTLTAVVAILATRSRPVAPAVVFGLVLGGGISNVVDRAARESTGGVVDFLTLPHWPAFNIADACISLGVVALVVLLALRRPLVEPWSGR